MLGTTCVRSATGISSLKPVDAAWYFGHGSSSSRYNKAQLPTFIYIHTMREIDLHYPEEKCPFCTIAAAYPVKEGGLWKKEEDLESVVPDGEVEHERTTPGSFVVLSSPEVLAFLDILPMVGGMCFLFFWFD